MNDIPRGTSRSDIISLLGAPIRSIHIQNSKLDEELSLAIIEFKQRPKWLQDLDADQHAFPKKTYLGTIWEQVDMVGRDKDGRTAFINAAMAGDLKLAELLAEFRQTNVNAKDDAGKTALRWACENSLADMVALLLSVPGLDSGLPADDGFTAFDISCKSENEAIPTLFYTSIFVMDKRNPDGSLLRLLTLTSEPDDDGKDEFPGQALFNPAAGGDQLLVKALIRRGVNLKAVNVDGDTALHLAAKGGHTNIVIDLVEAGSDINAMNNDDFTPLHHAAHEGHSETMKLLEKNGADPEMEDKSGKTATALYDSMGDINERDSEGFTALHRAVKHMEGETVRRLLSRGANIETRDDTYKRTALHWAASTGQPEILQLLLERGADKEVKDGEALGTSAKGLLRPAIKMKGDPRGQTALHLAAQAGHSGAVQVLLDGGVDKEVKDDKYGRTALGWAIKRRHQGVVRVLLEGGVYQENVDNTLKYILAIGAVAVPCLLIGSFLLRRR